MTVLCRVFCVVAAALLAPLAGAQSYPVKPIRVILSVPAGATPDVTARLVTPGLAGALGQPLVVDNRGGAGGLIGAEIVAKAAPDGYTVFISSPEEFAAFVRRDMEKYARVVRISGAKVD